MNKIIYTLLTIITLSFITTSAYAITVIGSVSCGVWINNKEKNKSDGWSSIVNQSWVLGYLSGSVVHSGTNIIKGTDKESIFLWIDNYCRANPLKDIDDAADDLYRELKMQKGL